MIDRFERDLQIEIIDSLLRVRESEMIRSRDRSSKAQNRRRVTKNVKNLHTDMKVKNHIDMKKVVSTARQQAFENSTLRQPSQFERVLMKTTLSDEMMNSKTVLAVHRADSASSRRRGRGRRRGRSRERERERRERGQAVSK